MDQMTQKLISNISFDVTHPSFNTLRIYYNAAFNTIAAKVTGQRNYASEIFFWEREFNTSRILDRPINVWDGRKENNAVFEEILGHLRKDFPEELKFIDVGSGPVSTFSYYLDINKMNITAVDPLAEYYNRLHEQYHTNYPIHCIAGSGEELDTLFRAESFHLVLCENALDHSPAPGTFINNLFRLAKKGGFIYISGYLKVGEAENWIGLHKHNLELEGNDLFLTNQDRSIDHVNITKSLNLDMYYKKADGTKAGDHFTVIYRKRRDVSTNAF